MPFAPSWFPMVSFYYASVRETEPNTNGRGGFDDDSGSVGDSGVDGAGGLIFQYSSGTQCFINPSEN